MSHDSESTSFELADCGLVFKLNDSRWFCAGFNAWLNCTMQSRNEVACAAMGDCHFCPDQMAAWVRTPKESWSYILQLIPPVSL